MQSAWRLILVPLESRRISLCNQPLQCNGGAWRLAVSVALAGYRGWRLAGMAVAG